MKVNADFNPFDPTWEPYAEQRLRAAMSDKLGHREQVLSLYRRQEGRCVHCGAPITWESGRWHGVRVAGPGSGDGAQAQRRDAVIRVLLVHEAMRGRQLASEPTRRVRRRRSEP